MHFLYLFLFFSKFSKGSKIRVKRDGIGWNRLSNNLNIPKIIGHRGVKNLAPENTLISILEAIKNVSNVENKEICFRFRTQYDPYNMDN